MSPEQSHQLFTWYPSVEPIAYYHKGGFHPIHIDNILQNHYHIVNKLGNGAYGTIWLVDNLTSGRCATLKVLAAEVSKEISRVIILHHPKQWQVNSGGLNSQEFLMVFLDDFKVEGPNGMHQCIVTEVFGPGIGTDVDELYSE